MITHIREASPVKTGTRVTVHWPVSASSILTDAKDRFLQIAADFTWLNPSLDLTVDWKGAKKHASATNPAWQKWRPSDPTCPHWYDRARLERLIAAYVSHDRGRPGTVREFVSEFRGLSATAKQAAVLDANRPRPCSPREPLRGRRIRQAEDRRPARGHAETHQAGEAEVAGPDRQGAP